MTSNPKLQQLLKKEGVSLAAIDVFDKAFDKGRMGARRYDAEQVDAFLDVVVKDYERFYKLLENMQIEIDALHESLANRGEISVETLHVRLRKVEHFLHNSRP
ncbi:DivIVA domain-containing protein [Cohnella sp. JJ-181]|uniref:DivIVA domain-containing protein n=1 Tax=Cohnella rhizoplanae TaxID=2974897 RepID=UPI0022FF506F|nr:DivIVA domain-containing protein [Cohnella sp. JJ-181]CAI6083202.1 Cell cycle protein GpsB [Cohnella sp. JJ-181]